VGQRRGAAGALADRRGDLFARGTRRLDDTRRRTSRGEILMTDLAPCLDLPAHSSVTVRHAA
jgi:hypothetical protein